MNLHRASEKPDWENTDVASRNVFQKIASNTHGVITPANVISILGLALVIFGLLAVLRGDIWIGVGAMAFGRLLDVADGWVAESTGTKSLLGEAVDAVIDKLGTLLTIAVLFILNIAPWWIIAALLIPQSIAPLIAFYKKQKGTTPHPTRSGKLSMATAWAGIIGLFLLYIGWQSIVLLAAVYIVIGLSLLFGLYALWQYAFGHD